ncbi:2-dehydropantoate 2-reductase [Seongchinamella unica]|uniref:2-dehydropantoate 2-reductase n=2 Tax=Seongchinamella unica TaxID=2547392 RepID=A0A4R5LUM2_9GAMM|nr:2-dehydropantoate 2-reductase [Seongchinamella unica]
MGCLFATAIGSAGGRVSLLLRPPLPATRGEITVESVEGNRTCPVTLDDQNGTSRIEQLLVCTKANDITDAVAGIAHRLKPGAPILLAANGMGYLDWFDRELPDHPIYCCLSTEGAYRIAPLHIRHAGRGRSLIGSPAGLPAPDWLQDWTASFLDVQWENAINRAQWHKLAINCAINPLTALYRCRNGELARNEVLKVLVEQLCDEISIVSAAAGFGDTAATIHRDVAGVIAGTAANRSSMLQDVIAGRTTEINFITGYLLSTAERLNIDAPLHRQLLQQVTELDL